MSEHVTQTIAMVQQEIDLLTQQLIEKKRMVNGLCNLIKQPPIYTDSDLIPSGGAGPIRPDEYYGQPLTTAIRMILDRRSLAKLGPASVNEIYDALIAGGYKFQTNVEEHAKRGLYSTLTKNTVTFHKVPNGSYGLLAWYPNAKEPRTAKGGKQQAEAASVATATEDLPTDEEIIDAPTTDAGETIEALSTDTTEVRRGKPR